MEKVIMTPKYRWFVELFFGKYEPVEKTYNSITAIEEDIHNRFPEYEEYYGVCEIEENDGFITILKEIRSAPKIYYEDEDEI